MRRQDLKFGPIYTYMRFLSKSCFLCVVSNNIVTSISFLLRFYTLYENLVKIGYVMKEYFLAQDLIFENQFSN